MSHYEWCYSLEHGMSLQPMGFMCDGNSRSSCSLASKNVGAHFLISQNQCSISNRLLPFVNLSSASLLCSKDITEIEKKSHTFRQIVRKKNVQSFNFNRGKWMRLVFARVKRLNALSDIQHPMPNASIFACNIVEYAAHYTGPGLCEPHSSAIFV